MVISACITEPLVLVHRGFSHPHQKKKEEFQNIETDEDYNAFEENRSGSPTGGGGK
jgi:hypothetical protein